MLITNFRISRSIKIKTIRVSQVILMVMEVVVLLKEVKNLTIIEKLTKKPNLAKFQKTNLTKSKKSDLTKAKGFDFANRNSSKTDFLL